MKERLGAAAPSQMVQTDTQRAKAREALGVERYEQLRSEGAGMSSPGAIGLADQFEPPPDAPPLPRAKPWGVSEAPSSDVLPHDTEIEEHADA
jgi:hypothetical protein